MKRLVITSLLSIGFISLTTLSAPSPAATAAMGVAAAETRPLLSRVAMIGASVTDGFLLPHEVDAMISLADPVAAALRIEGDLPFRRSSPLFFNDEERFGASYVEQAMAHRPTLVIGVDFLFWYGFGFQWGLTEAGRVERLERGLALLATFDCPVLIGDLPGVGDAATKGVGIHGYPMISRSQVPRPETLVTMNERIGAFVDEHPNVHLVPLARFFQQLRDGERFELRGVTFDGSSYRKLMDPDLLHPNFEGAIQLTRVIADTLVKGGLVDATTIEWDAKKIRERVLESHRAERAIRTRHRSN